jgi:hypothetical protein
MVLQMKKVIVLSFLLLGLLKLGFSQVNSVSQAQSMFIYNFCRLIQWPASSGSGEFVIGVLGSNDVYTSLTAFVANKKVGALPIVVKKFDDPQQLTRCQILFVGNSRVSKLNEILSRLQDANSLIITEKRGMVNSGSAIDFFMDEDRLRFVMNIENAEKNRLIVSKSLQDMAYKD